MARVTEYKEKKHFDSFTAKYNCSKLLTMKVLVELKSHSPGKVVEKMEEGMEGKADYKNEYRMERSVRCFMNAHLFTRCQPRILHPQE